ncbi:hypothetical protein ABPG77_001378, partial [Micractinium sp. CCAP 211/92]
MARSRSRSLTRDRSRDRKRDRSRSRSRDRSRDAKRYREDREERRGDYRSERVDRERERRDDRDRRPYDRDRERERRDDRYPPRQDDRGGYNGRRDDRDRERERPERRGDDRGGRDSRSGRREETDGRREAERERDTRPDSAAAGAEEELAQPSNGEGPAKKKEPLSLEELLKQRKAEQEAQAKPVFLTKEQRAKLALEKRAEEAAAARERLAAMRAGLAASGLGPVASNGSGPGPSGRDGGRDGGRDRDRGNRRDDRRDGRDRRDGQDDESARGKEERERQRELELIKQQYLGAEKQKKKILKATERMKFVFDWDAAEDTSRDLNPLYQNLHEANLLFGRGFRAGIDRREQKKTAAEAEADMLRRKREQTGTPSIRETAEDRARDRQRRDYADKYDGADMRVDTHWSEKPREAMTDRDWRIFREDFNISYKGVNPALRSA